jgi:hypothetical protein
MALLNQMSSYFGMGGVSEEERRREEEERLRAEASTTPFKQTIVTDPVTGRQTMKMEGDVKDFSAANPNTPTVSGPAVPGSNIMADYANQRIGDLNQRMEAVSGMVRDPDAYMRQRLGMPTTAPVAPATTAPTAEGIMAGPPREAMMPPEAPVAPAQPTAPTMEGVMAGPPREAMMPAQPGAATEAPASKAVAEAQRIKTAATTAPTAEGLAMGPSMADAQPEAYTSKIEAAKNNPQALAAINADSQAPSWARSLAAEELGSVFSRQQKERQQEQRLNTIVQNQGKGFERALKDPSEEGSIFRAYLYARFGLNDLAKQEQQKLGAGDSYMQIDLPEGGKASVKFSEDGTAKSGIDHATGKPVARNVLEKLYGMGGGAVGKNLDIVGGTFVNDQTGEVGRVVTDKRTGKSVIQTDTGMKPMTGFRPQASAGSLNDQRAQLIQKMNIELQGKTKEEQMIIQRDYNRLLVGQRLAPLQPNDTPFVAPQIAGGPAAAQPARVAAPVVPTTVTPTAPPAGARATPTATELEATGAAEKKVAEITAEDRAKIINNYGQIKENVDIIENLGKELVNHPGFEVSVGASAQPGFQFVPGTDKASFYSRFEEIKGKQFLAAIESLKGTGAISDAEGKAATAAVSRLSTAQNEKEFRKAQHEFTSMMKRYADRASIKVGKDPIYNEPTMSQQVKENSEARRWLQKNAKDPRAEEVRQKLRERGEL